MTRQPTTSHRVNGPALWRALDTQRRQRGLSWRGVAREAGTSTGSLFTRLQNADLSLHGDALVSLLVWLGMADQIAPIIQATGATPEPDEDATAGDVDALVHTLQHSTVSQLQQAFRWCGMTLQFELADQDGDQQP